MFLLDNNNKDMLFRKTKSNFQDITLVYWKTLSPLVQFSIYYSKRIPPEMMGQIITDYLSLVREYELKDIIDIEEEMTNNPTCITCGREAKVLNTKNTPICTPDNELAIKYWRDDQAKTDQIDMNCTRYCGKAITTNKDHTFHICTHCATIVPDDFIIGMLQAVLVGDLHIHRTTSKDEEEKPMAKRKLRIPDKKGKST